MRDDRARYAGGLLLLAALALTAVGKGRWPAAVGANLVLCLFNLLPIRPLDGGRALYLLASWAAGPAAGRRHGGYEPWPGHEPRDLPARPARGHGAGRRGGRAGVPLSGSGRNGHCQLHSGHGPLLRAAGPGAGCAYRSRRGGRSCFPSAGRSDRPSWGAAGGLPFPRPGPFR